MRCRSSVWNALADAVRARRARFFLPALVASLAAVSAMRSDDADPTRARVQQQAQAQGDRDAANAEHPSVDARPRQPDIDAVVALAARKYRIADAVVRDFVATAFAEARRNRLDPLLVVAVIGIESRFNPVARSEAGARGLMQVIPRFHRDKFSAAKGETVLDPRTNIRVGTLALKEYVALGGNEAAGLQLYNGSMNDPERTYARKVLAERARLREAVRRLASIRSRA